MRHGTSAPREVRLNGELLRGERESNPYRTDGLCVSAAQIAPLLNASDNRLEIEL